MPFMTWLALILKPILAPVILFVWLLSARWGAIVVYRLLPDGKARRALFDPTLLDRKPWIRKVAVLGVIVFAVIVQRLSL